MLELHLLYLLWVRSSGPDCVAAPITDDGATSNADDGTAPSANDRPDPNTFADSVTDNVATSGADDDADPAADDGADSRANDRATANRTDLVADSFSTSDCPYDDKHKYDPIRRPYHDTIIERDQPTAESCFRRNCRRH